MLMKGGLPDKIKGQEPMADPLSNVWDKAKGDTHLLTGGYWDVAFGRKKNTLGEIVEGWTLHVCPTGKDAPASLSIWFKQMADLLAASASPAGVKRVEKEIQSLPAHALYGAPNIPDTLAAAIAEIPENMDEEDDPEPRLPANATEQAELENLIASGPGPIYAWIYGPKSQMATMMKNFTWESMGKTDPKAELGKLIEGIRKSMAQTKK